MKYYYVYVYKIYVTITIYLNNKECIDYFVIDIMKKGDSNYRCYKYTI